MKKVLALGALVALAPFLLAHPVSAAPLGYDTYGVTVLASGVRTAGDVGASGGLVTLDTGSAAVSAQIDSGPSSAVLAVPYEPGTLFRTGVGQVNDAAGETVLDVPDAEASYPGHPSGDLETVPTSGPPVIVGAGSATARATAVSASGTATGQAFDLAGLITSEASTSEVALTADGPRQLLTGTARTSVGRVSVAGVFELRNVVAKATIKAVGDIHTPTATLTLGGASVAGQEVALTEKGVVAVGMTVVPATTLQQATDAANAALTAAGITVSVTGTRTAHTARDAVADTGGVTISLTTPDLPGGVAGNRLQVIVGGVALTATDTLAAPLPVVPEIPVGSVVVPGVPPVSTTTVIPGTPGSVGQPGAGQAPVTAGPGAVASSYEIAGRHLSGTAAIAAFGVWQFLTMGSVSLYAYVDRRRRQQLAEQ